MTGDREGEPDGDGAGDEGNQDSEDASGDSLDPFADDDESQSDESADAFGALSDTLRIEILQALADHHGEAGEQAPIGFADLRRRVGVRDSGRFRYHLRKLQGHFVAGGEEGYRLTHAGVEVVAAIHAGTYTDRPSMGPAELDSDCPFCGGSAVAAYEEGFCRVACPEEHPLFGWAVPPNAVTDATLPEVVDLAQLLARQAIELTVAGTCPKCYDPIEARVEADGDRPALRADCETCGGRLTGPAGFCLLVDPQVAAWFRRHGRPLRERHVWEPSFVHDDGVVDVVDQDPPRVAFDIELDGESLVATVDGTGRVVDVER